MVWVGVGKSSNFYVRKREMALEVKRERSSSAAASVFEAGKLNVDVSFWKPSRREAASSPPKPLVIVRPMEVREYPVLIFFYGFNIRNYFYTDLFKHVASYFTLLFLLFFLPS